MADLSLNKAMLQDVPSKKSFAKGSPMDEPTLSLAGSTGSRSLRKLIDAASKAHSWLQELMAEVAINTAAVTQHDGVAERSIRRTLSLAFVAPDIIESVIEGRLPRGFNLTSLLDLPMDWQDQRRHLGLPAKIWDHPADLVRRYSNHH